ncbi:MAG: glycosyltransferase [Bacteroidia bacterium]|nr:glycosyltransferase [Bacteroidia bacterium]
MLSIIIIGKNEGWKLTLCLKSVYESLEQCGINLYEVIYVDSGSTDDSINRAQNFPKTRIFKITGESNPAIGRNVGAEESRGDTLLFLDGDMELKAENFNQFYSEHDGLKKEFLTGNWINRNYDNFEDKKVVSEKRAFNLKEDITDYKVGGLFFIKKSLWTEVGGMKNKMRRHQDVDMALRLAKKGVFLNRKKEMLAIHHTTSPRQNIKKMIFRNLRGSTLYRIVGLRDNIFNKYQWLYFFRNSYTFVFLIICVLSSILLKNYYFLLFYFLVLFIRTLFRKQFLPHIMLSNMLVILLNEMSYIFTFIFFWPKNHKIEYISIEHQFVNKL